ncbi:MAG TPA: glycosyltransferase [Solirubrobacteraceae bacterium]
MRRALVIAYFFPPLGGAGVQRTLKFVRYLPEFGWRTTVVSTSSRIYGTHDPSLAAEIPEGTRVVRAPALPLARILAIVLYRLRLHRLRAWVSWPDGGLGWAPLAFLAAWREARRQRPDVIFSSASPYGGHLAAMLLSRLTGIPWVADFRDDWSSSTYLAGQPRPLPALTRRAEGAFTAAARRVVVAADYFRLEGDPPQVTIENGVDGADVPAGSEPPPGDKFRLSFTGTLYESIDARPLMDAALRLIETGAIDPQRFELRVVGTVMIPGFAPPAGLPLVTTGYVSHERAVEEMRSATALLLYRPPGSLAPSGKIFEYLAAERPVLCVTRADNLAARLVADWGAGAVADPADAAAIEAALRSLYERWSEGALEPPRGVRERVLERYSRRELTRRLAEVLDDASRERYGQPRG